MYKKALFLMVVCVNLSPIYAQFEVDTTRTNNRKNVIRWNPTPMIVVGAQSFVFGYERVLTPYQSVSVNFGQLKFRQLIDLDLSKYGVNTERKSQGYSLAIDYRRYFKKRNRALAPDGLYWGPFFTYYHYNIELGFDYTDPNTQAVLEANVGANIDVYQLGIELGYQFILFKRLAVDLILVGPSFGRYSANFYVSSNVDTDDIDDVYKDVFNRLTERVPALGTLIEYKSLETNGRYGTDTFGMRYVMQLGFVF